MTAVTQDPAAVPGRGQSISAALRRAWWRTAALVTAVGMLCVILGGTAFATLRPELAHAAQVQDALRDLHTGMLDQETGLRGYLLTGDQGFLAPYRAGVSTAEGARARLAEDGTATVGAVIAAADEWERRWSIRALTHPVGGANPPNALLGEGKTLFDAYRHAEAEAGVHLSRRVQRSEATASALLAAGTLATAGAMVTALVVARRGFRRMQASISTPVSQLIASIDALHTGVGASALAATAASELRELDQRLADVGARMATTRARTAALLDVHRAIASSTLDEQRTMDLITAQVGAVTSADGAVLELRDGAEMLYAAVGGHAREYLGLRVPLHGSASGRCATSGTTLRIDDSETDPRVDQAAARAVGARSMLVVPLRHDGSVVGVLKVYAGRPAFFTVEDEQTLELLSGLAAVAVHNARTHAMAISDRRAAERSELRFRSLFDRSPVGQTELAVDGSVLHVNEVFAAMLGHTPAGLVGTPIADLVHPLDAEGFAAAMRRVETGEISHYTGRRTYRHADGRAVIALISAALVTDAAGERHMIGTAVDISASERTQAALAESEQQLRRMFDAAPVGIIVRDTGGHIMRTNRAFADLVGYDVGDLLGLRVDLLTHPEDIPAARAALATIAAGTRDVALVEKRYRRADGTTLWTAATSTALEYDGQPAILTYVTDITERRAAADHLAHLALHDQLTGLPNRAAALAALDTAHREGTAVAVLFIDLDGFKPINDEHGHHAGDAVLTEVAGRLTAAVRPGDLATRFAGDEFVLICPGLADDAGARMLAARVEAMLNAPIQIGDTSVRVGASIGIAVAAAGDDPSSLLSAADAAMYRTKRAHQQLRVGVPAHPGGPTA
ncbi:MAG: diguanylate cyclase with sensor [Mycobacterium sp.]|nr:diguanylate cyclase with sensor [Mycobacterium sp.]